MTILTKLWVTSAAVAQGTTGARNATADRSTGKCPSGAVRAAGHNDGFGAQFLAMFSVFVYARQRGKTFCTSRWHRLDFNQDAKAVWDWFGGDAYGPSYDGTSAIETIASAAKIINWADSAPERSFAHAAYAERIAMRRPVNELFANDTGRLTIAMHIRAGSDMVTPDGERKKNIFVRRWSLWEHRVACLDYLAANVTGDRPYALHVFTDGKYIDFSPLARFHPRLHIDYDLISSLDHMIAADIHVIAKSSFSESAAILRNNADHTYFPFTADHAELSFLRMDRTLGKTCVPHLCHGMAAEECNIGW